MMTIRTVLMPLAVACLFACSGKPGSGDSQTADTSSNASLPSAVAFSECYVYETAKDSASLRIDIAEDQMAVGELSYSLFEKDRNRGKIMGVISGDTLVARYTFTAEGQESVREVVFLKKGSGWVEGFGEVKDSAGVMIFSDRSKLDFEKGMHFEPVECAGAQ
jgi:hypothetical protein